MAISLCSMILSCDLKGVLQGHSHYLIYNFKLRYWFWEKSGMLRLVVRLKGISVFFFIILVLFSKCFTMNLLQYFNIKIIF